MLVIQFHILVWSYQHNNTQRHNVRIGACTGIETIIAYSEMRHELNYSVLHFSVVKKLWSFVFTETIPKIKNKTKHITVKLVWLRNIDTAAFFGIHTPKFHLSYCPRAYHWPVITSRSFYDIKIMVIYIRAGLVTVMSECSVNSQPSLRDIRPSFDLVFCVLTALNGPAC